MSIMRLIDPVRFDEMVQGVLYDGFDECDELTIQEILAHNAEQRKDNKLRTFFTSSVLNFCSILLAASQSLIPERSKFNANYEAQEVMNIEANTEKQLVCACIEASSQFHCLLSRLHLKCVTLEQMISNVYREGKQDSDRDLLINLNKSMVQSQ